MHNEVVKSDIHSTDAFGFSELVFAVSHPLGFSYAPRFKNLPRQRLYIFKSRKGVDRSTRPRSKTDFAIPCAAVIWNLVRFFSESWLAEFQGAETCIRL